MPELIRNVAAWFSTDDAAAWMHGKFGDGDILMRRVDPHGMEITVTGRDGVTQLSLGVRSEELVRIGRYILSMAAAQGQNINQGFTPGERN